MKASKAFSTITRPVAVVSHPQSPDATSLIQSFTAAMLLPKFVGPRSDLLLKPPCSKAPLQLPPQFLYESPEALRRRLVTNVGSEPPCPFDLALKFASIFTLIHGGPLQ